MTSDRPNWVAGHRARRHYGFPVTLDDAPTWAAALETRLEAHSHAEA